MGIRDVGRRGHAGSSAAHRRASTALEGIEEHLRFSQVFTCLDNSPLSILVGLTGLSLSVLHSAPPRSPCSSDAMIGVDAQDLAGLHILTDERRVSV